MQNKSIHVLATRPLTPEVVENAGAHGVSIDVIPFISTGAIEEVGVLLAGLKSRSIVAVFTSSAAVDAVAGFLPEAREVFCLEAATRSRVVSVFGEDAIVDTAPSAASLASKIVARGVREVFFFCGDLRREELPSVLREAGCIVNEVVVYKTVMTPVRLERAYSGVLFFSPSAVESFFSLNALSSSAAVFVIGHTTLAAVRERFGGEVVVSSRPDQAVLIQEVIQYYNK